MMKGTLESELRTRFCPMRFTYSVTTGSATSLTPCSICWEYCWPIATCFSSEYQLPAPVLQPTLRLQYGCGQLVLAGEASGDGPAVLPADRAWGQTGRRSGCHRICEPHRAEPGAQLRFQGALHH